MMRGLQQPSGDEQEDHGRPTLPEALAPLVEAVPLPEPPAIPAAPALPAAPPTPTVPSIPTAPSIPTVPRIPSAPSIPSIPGVPAPAALGRVAEVSGVVSQVAGAAAAVVPPAAREAVQTVARVASQVQSYASAASAATSAFSPPSQAPSGGGGSGGETLPEVEYVVLFDGAASSWAVHTLRLREAVSELYELTLELANEDLTADPDDLLEARCTVEIRRRDLIELRHGVVRRVERAGVTNTRRLARVTVVPALHHLSQTVDARIFQDLTALDVIGEVLDGHGLYAETRTLEVERAPAVREYCVQYHESDLAFVMRLMEEEGIWFYFRHEEDDGEERLVLTDHARSLAPVPTLDGEAAPVAGPESATLAVESVRFFDLGRELRPTGTTARDFDWTRPGLDLTRAEPSDAGSRAVYEYPAELTLGQYQDPSYGSDDGAAQARVRQEARAATAATAAARTNLVGARPGAVLELVGHGDPAHDGRYLVLRVEHHGAVPDAVAGTTRAEPRGDRERYRNELVCAPVDVPHRPERRTTKPRIFGMQTATVVGPPGEEIYTDEHGRVKAQFHWDRLGARDEKSSCWIRVMQAWSGPGWGSIFLPRIGMEVVVNFLEGNPDRPLVIGCVYNGVNRPPYTLPDEKTKSTVKSNSSPGGGGSNEIRFEDLAGSEEVYLHAQKDLNEVVENNHTTTVHANQTDTVDGNQTISVGGDQTESVDKNVTVHIKGSQSVTIDGTMQGDGHPVTGAGLNITGKYKVDASDTIEVQAPTHIKLTCGGSSILIEPGKITLTAGGAAKVVLDTNALMQSAAVSKVFLDASANVHASTGGDLLLDPNATLTSNAGSQVALDANAVVAAVAGAFLELTADALLKGANATMNADTASTVSAPTATLQGASGSVEASGSGVAASGPQVNIAAQGATNISGSVVKIN